MSEASKFSSLLFRVAEEENGKDTVLTLGGVPVFVIQNIESAHQVLRRSAANFEKNMVWFRQALGSSRFTENGQEWHIRQTMSQTYLSRFDRQRAFEVATRRAETAFARLATDSATGADVLDDAILRELAAAVMLEVFFHRDLDASDINLDDIAAMLRFGTEYSFVPEKALIPFPAGVTRAFLKVRSKVLKDMQSFRTGDVVEDGLLARIRAMDADGGHSFHLEHEMTMFFAAASETTAATMGWACFLLARNPAVQSALQDVLDAIPAEDQENWQILERVTPLRNFILEVLRMFPSTPVIARRALKNERIGDYEVVGGEQILISLVGIQHDRSNHPDPWLLDLNRTEGVGPNAGQSISFSLGPRMCGGSRFALVELMALLSVFIRKGHFHPTSTEAPRFRFQTQLMHDNGQPVHVAHRVLRH